MAEHRSIGTRAMMDTEVPGGKHYLAVMDQLSGQALTPADTVGFIEQVASET